MLILFVFLNTLHYYDEGMTFFNQLAQSSISRGSAEWAKPGYSLKKIPGSPESLASLIPIFSSSPFDRFPTDSGTNGSSAPCPQKTGTVVACCPRSYQRRVKSRPLAAILHTSLSFSKMVSRPLRTVRPASLCVVVRPINKVMVAP